MKVLHEKKLSQWAVPLLIFAMLELPAHARGGDGTRGGADGVSCNGGIFELFLGRSDTAVADTFDARNRLPLNTLDFTDDDTILQSIFDYVESSQSESAPESAKELRQGYSELSFHKVTRIPTLQTGFKIGLFEKFFGCSRKQLALQNLETGEVSLPTREFEKELHSISKALVKLHEIYIHLAHLSDPSADLATLEIRARNSVSVIYNALDFNRFVLRATLARSNRSPADVSEVLRPWIRKVFWDLGDARFGIADLEQALDAGFDPNYEVTTDIPVLFYALSRTAPTEGSGFGYVDSLIRHGANLDARDIYGNTILALAIDLDVGNRNENNESFPSVAHFLKQGVNINAPICARTSKPIAAGSAAETVLDWSIALASRQTGFWNRILSDNTGRVAKNLQSYLIGQGGRTGQELGLTCPAAPALTQPEVDLANKLLAARKFMGVQIW